MHWAENYTWAPTDTQYVWLCVETGKYWFSDETHCLEGNGPYDSEELASEGLALYCQRYL